uniref:Uncharacterized protein n=1 Tax=Desertifilum tharense IPPAS B-1220 TaxID=1781255 RepID=A0ACD5GX69_9CYAN
MLRQQHSALFSPHLLPHSALSTQHFTLPPHSALLFPPPPHLPIPPPSSPLSTQHSALYTL